MNLTTLIIYPLVMGIVVLISRMFGFSWAQSIGKIPIATVYALVIIGVGSWMMKTLPYWLNILIALGLAVLWRSL